jgi:hypothetical protein
VPCLVPSVSNVSRMSPHPLPKLRGTPPKYSTGYRILMQLVFLPFSFIIPVLGGIQYTLWIALGRSSCWKTWTKAAKNAVISTLFHFLARWSFMGRNSTRMLITVWQECLGQSVNFQQHVKLLRSCSCRQGRIST